jgi:hypothetical protein
MTGLTAADNLPAQAVTSVLQTVQTYLRELAAAGQGATVRPAARGTWSDQREVPLT